MYKNIYVIYKFLSKKNKSRIIKIFFLGLISNLLEIIALSTLFPLILLLLNDNTSFLQNEYLDFFFLNFSNDKLFSFLSLLFVISFIIKNIYLYYFQKYKFRSIYYLSKDLKIMLFDTYLKKNFVFFKQQKYSQIIQNIRSEAPQIALNIINCCLDIAIDSLLILFVYLFLLFLNPEPIIILTIFLLIYFIFVKNIFQKKLNYYGEQRLNYEIQQTKLTNESIYGIKDVILFKLGNNLKKILSEIINHTIIPQYKSLLIINSIRLMPNFLNIFKNYQSISFYYPSGKKIIDFIKKNISEIKVKKNFKINNNFKINQIVFKNVSFKYPNSNYIFKKLNLKISTGEKVIIMGNSGSGKSTFLDTLTGLIYPTSGKVIVNNEALNQKNLYNYQNKLSYSSQENFIFSGNILNNFKFNTEENKIISKEKFIELKKIFLDLNINFIKYDSKNIINERGTNFSGGEKQKISLARAIFKNSDMVVLDEPTSSLDDKNSHKIIQRILKYCKNKIVICVSHDKKLIKYFDRALYLTNNRLYKI